MRSHLVVSVLFASAFAQGALNPSEPRNLVNAGDIKPRQTADTAECATIFEPLVTGVPSLPPDFISFWSDNNPQTKGCLAQPPASLTSQFASVYDDFGSWISSNEGVFSSIASKCPQYNFNGGDFAKRADSPAVYTELPPEAASWLKIATASASAITSAVEPTTTPVKTGSISTPSAVLVNGGDRSMVRPVYFVAIAGMAGAAVVM
ncbi:hypothetical protein Neosp_001380 [[Neocosmospora] mangrovei]